MNPYHQRYDYGQPPPKKVFALEILCKGKARNFEVLPSTELGVRLARYESESERTDLKVILGLARKLLNAVTAQPAGSNAAKHGQVLLHCADNLMFAMHKGEPCTSELGAQHSLWSVAMDLTNPKARDVLQKIGEAIDKEYQNWFGRRQTQNAAPSPLASALITQPQPQPRA